MPKSDRPQSSQFWAQEVNSKALALSERLKVLMAETDLPDRSPAIEIDRLIHHAQELAGAKVTLFSWARLADWWYGSRVEDAWASLHQAELLLAGAAQSGRLFYIMMEDAFEHAQHLDPTSTIRQRFETLFEFSRPTST